MAKHRKASPSAPSSRADKPSTLQDLLSPDTVSSLKEAANRLKAQEEEQKLVQREQRERVRKAEQQRLENDFEHLLNQSDPDWRKHK